jgi:hypothetical protein
VSNEDKKEDMHHEATAMWALENAKYMLAERIRQNMYNLILVTLNTFMGAYIMMILDAARNVEDSNFKKAFKEAEENLQRILEKVEKEASKRKE